MAVSRTIVAGFVLVATACVSENNTNKSDAHWTVSCTQDTVSVSKTCRAFTFGRPMDGSGQPYGQASIPFQVYFIDESGPYLVVGLHTFPGERPSVRFDDDGRPFVIANDGGVTAPRPAHEAVARMKTASVARGRYWTWPDGPHDMYVDLSGFQAAYEELLTQLR